MLQIEAHSGKAKALAEGRAEVLLSNHVSAASIVNVSKVESAVVDHSGPPMLNSDDGKESQLRIRIKMYLSKHGEELMPTVQYDGVTLIRHNLSVKCESSDPSWVEARSEVIDLDGYFCVVRFTGKSSRIKDMPRFVKISVLAQAPGEYSNQVASFDVQLVSAITTDPASKSIRLNSVTRTKSIKVFSSSDLEVKIDALPEVEGPLLKHHLTPTDEHSNEYKLTLTVPNWVSQPFETTVRLYTPFAKQSKVLSVLFSGDDRAELE